VINPDKGFYENIKFILRKKKVKVKGGD